MPSPRLLRTRAGDRGYDDTAAVGRRRGRHAGRRATTAAAFDVTQGRRRAGCPVCRGTFPERVEASSATVARLEPLPAPDTNEVRLRRRVRRRFPRRPRRAREGDGKAFPPFPGACAHRGPRGRRLPPQGHTVVDRPTAVAQPRCIYLKFYASVFFHPYVVRTPLSRRGDRTDGRGPPTGSSLRRRTGLPPPGRARAGCRTAARRSAARARRTRSRRRCRRAASRPSASGRRRPSTRPGTRAARPGRAAAPRRRRAWRRGGGHRRQQRVADGVAERVVDGLEAV